MNHPRELTPTLNDTADKGAAVYSKPVLSIYDLFVLGFSNSFVWKCPSRRILALYNDHVADKHLDIGVGTGYFLDRCRFPSTSPKIALLDLNPNCLQATTHRLRRYDPSCHIANVLKPFEIDESEFGSIGLNYLLHCLPGNLADKSVVFEHAKPLLRKGGALFGATILGEDVEHNALAKRLMRIYNAKGIFGNATDRLSDLEAGLKNNFERYTVRVVGCVAMFSAWK